MLRYHIDIFAVGLIALVMVAFSEARSLKFAGRGDVIRIQNASFSQPDCVGERMLADLASFLNQ